MRLSLAVVALSFSLSPSVHERPTEPRLWIHLGDALARAGRDEESLHAFRKVQIDGSDLWTVALQETSLLPRRTLFFSSAKLAHRRRSPWFQDLRRISTVPTVALLLNAFRSAALASASVFLSRQLLSCTYISSS